MTATRPFLLVTFTGGAGAGKTTAADAVGLDQGAPVVHLDDFYLDLDARPATFVDESGNERVDVGHPGAIDWAVLRARVAELGGSAPTVIVEGLFAASAMLQHRGPRLDVYVDLDDDLRLVRRIERKVIQGGIPLEVILGNYVNHRRRSHEEHTLPLRDRCTLVVSGSAPEAEIVAAVRKVLPSLSAPPPAPGGVAS